MGVVVEVPPVEQDLSIDAVLGPQAQAKKDKDERKKVRVCRDCLGTVLCVSLSLSRPSSLSSRSG